MPLNEKDTKIGARQAGGTFQESRPEFSGGAAEVFNAVEIFSNLIYFDIVLFLDIAHRVTLLHTSCETAQS